MSWIIQLDYPSRYGRSLLWQLTLTSSSFRRTYWTRKLHTHQHSPVVLHRRKVYRKIPSLLLSIILLLPFIVIVCYRVQSIWVKWPHSPKCRQCLCFFDYGVQVSIRRTDDKSRNERAHCPFSNLAFAGNINGSAGPWIGDAGRDQSVLTVAFSLLSSHCRVLQAQFFFIQLLSPGHYNLGTVIDISGMLTKFSFCACDNYIHGRNDFTHRFYLSHLHFRQCWPASPHSIP